MSKDPYYQHVRRSSSGVSTSDGSLPSFSSTSSYWYDAHAHSSVNLGMYPQEPQTSFGYKQESRDPVIIDSGRDESDCWTDGLHQTNTQKTFDGQYWSDTPSPTGREFIPPCNIPGTPVEYECVRNPPPLQLLTSPDTTVPQDLHLSGASSYSMESSPRHDFDDRMTTASIASSEEYFSHSNGSSEVCTPNKKKSSDPSLSPCDPKKNQKRPRKEVKEKVREEKRCGVCGDVARSMHFGGMACDSCKAFFRRSVQSGAYKNFQCPEDEQCPISKQNRKVCQYCRFKKSQENGMEISWVMSETDRMTLWKNRLAKQRHVQEEKIRSEVYGDLPRTLDPDEADKLKNLTALQEATFSSIPYPDDCYGNSIESLANIFVCICQKLGIFFQKVQDFSEICKNDQSLLLKNGIGMSIYLHGAYMYDAEKDVWPHEFNKEAFKIPSINRRTLKEFTKLPGAFDAIMKFYRKYEKELKDEIILSLMCVIAFYQPDDPQFTYPEKIQDIQVTYLEHLRHYLLAKEGDSGVKVTFPKLLVGLADIREILEFHSKVDINPTINHLKVASQSSLKSQTTAVLDLFSQGAQGIFPDFASVLNSHEKQNLPYRSTDRAVGRRYRKRSGTIMRPVNHQYYHPQTNQIFGSNPRIDMIISNPMDEIDKFIKKHKLSIAQVTDVTDDSSSDSQALQRKTYRSGSLDVDSSPRNSLCEDSYMEIETSHSPNQMQLVTSSSIWENRSSSPPTDKKRAVEVLCDILKHISCNDDDNLLQSLKQNLPPQLLDNLAQKLNPM